jgi:hypothetical protein
MMIKVWALVVFSGELDPDPDAAAEELRHAGFEVHRLPKKYRALLDHELDDFVEATIDAPAGLSPPGLTVTDFDAKILSATMREVGHIVSQYGGCCEECGPISTDEYRPFEDYFGAAHARDDVDVRLRGD